MTAQHIHQYGQDVKATAIRADRTLLRVTLIRMLPAGPCSAAAALTGASTFSHLVLAAPSPLQASPALDASDLLHRWLHAVHRLGMYERTTCTPLAASETG